MATPTCALATARTAACPQQTDFTRDVLGRYICNGFDEMCSSADINRRPDARPFDMVVVGGGTFGAVLAQHLLFRDKKRSHRILVLEGGPLMLPEHAQNLPTLGLEPPPPDTLTGQLQSSPTCPPRNEIWGLAWHSAIPFPGLAYCIGGRSLFWGGWSPRLLNAEMSRWPQDVANDLKATYFAEASLQIGVNETNDFIFGPLHEALRQRLFTGISNGMVTGAIPLAELPQHLDNVPPGAEELLKLEAPLAVESRSGRPGFFPVNKFSTVPLLTKAARAAWLESNGDDVKKRLMIVPNCHVKWLGVTNSRITQVATNLGNVPIPPEGNVFIALGTIESTRLALNSFQSTPNYHLIGHNLMAHLRSNLTIRIPRSALPTLPRELQASALFVKGQHRHADDTVRYFHLQITAAGLGPTGMDPEVELFKKVPDLDSIEQLQLADDSHVVITIRGIGEMEPQNPNSSVTLVPTQSRFPSETDEFGVRRALVTIQPSAKDNALRDAMDQAAADTARVLAGGPHFEVLAFRRDGLGTTHHEAGTLWMGDDPAASVTNSDGRFHAVANAYVTGPALFPTIGSPNPMLTGVAMIRRLVERLVPEPTPLAVEPGFTLLFDGIETTNWRMSTAIGTSPGRFILVDGTLESVPGDEIGLLWHTQPTPGDFVLRLEWKAFQEGFNSGVYIRFPDPNTKGYNNTAYVADHFGFEVQIGHPASLPEHQTGAVYGQPDQTLTLQPERPPGEWNEFEITVQGQTYTVLLNGAQVTSFAFQGEPGRPDRGLPSAPGAPRFIGLQTYPDPRARVAFRNIRLKPL